MHTNASGINIRKGNEREIGTTGKKKIQNIDWNAKCLKDRMEEYSSFLSEMPAEAVVSVFYQ